MWNDPIVEEICAIRRKHTDKFRGDVAAIFADIRRRERESGCEFVTFAPSGEVVPPMPSLPPDSSPSQATS